MLVSRAIAYPAAPAANQAPKSTYFDSDAAVASMRTSFSGARNPVAASAARISASARLRQAATTAPIAAMRQIIPIHFQESPRASRPGPPPGGATVASTPAAYPDPPRASSPLISPPVPAAR